MRYIAMLAAVIVAITVAPTAGEAATGTSAMSKLSGQAALGTTTTAVNSSGTYMTSTVSLDTTATNATVASDGYLCGDVQYRATQRGYNITNSVMWTYRSTFGVHVCHNLVHYVTALYDEPMDTFFGYSWCGNIVRQQLNSLPYSSARSYTKGCFTLAYKLSSTYYPWARMTIGGNGNLWVRDTGF